MTMYIDSERGHKAGRRLFQAFRTSGILGRKEMPEDILPIGMQRGSLDHILFITLTVSIDYQRDADALWKASRMTYENKNSRYLFDPRSLHEHLPRTIISDMQKYHLSKKATKDAEIWRTVGVTFYKKWGGNPRNFLADCGWDAINILYRLKIGQHLYNNRLRNDYPYLRGDKIGPLWLRMLRDNVGLNKIINLDKVPIPVDIHVARATLALGIVKGNYNDSLAAIYENIRQAWFESVKGLKVDRRSMIALDVDEPLWHLSRYGCTDRDKNSGKCPHFLLCELKDYCTPGRLEVNSHQVIMVT
jgi:hypothetical protein